MQLEKDTHVVSYLYTWRILEKLQEQLKFDLVHEDAVK